VSYAHSVMYLTVQWDGGGARLGHLGWQTLGAELGQQTSGGAKKHICVSFLPLTEMQPCSFYSQQPVVCVVSEVCFVDVYREILLPQYHC